MGEGLALLSATCFAFGNIAIVKGSVAAKGDRGATLSVVITVCVATFFWLVLERGAYGDPASPDWASGMVWFALAGVFAMALGRSFVFVSIRRLGATRAASVKRLNPFFSVILAVMFLGEPIGWADLAGMTLIASSFAMLLHVSRLDRVRNGGADSPAPIDYAWGVAAAISYAGAYIVRKFGLIDISLPAFGTMISAIAGLLAIMAMALFIGRYRDNLRNMIRDATGWVVVAGLLISFGQITMFAALFYEDIATVVMIAALEIFISNLLAVYVFGIERRADPSLIVAAILATIGATLVAGG